MKMKWILIIAVVSAFATGQAADVTLTNSGDWSVGSNWDTGVPATGDSAIITGSLTASITGGSVDLYRLYLSFGNDSAGTLNMTAGTLATGNNFTFGNNTGSTGTFNFSGGTASPAGNTLVGQSGTGILNLSGTAAFSTVNKTVFLGNGTADSDGTVNMTGGSMDFRTIYVGRNGTGNFNISDGTLDMDAGGDLLVGTVSGAGTFKVTGTNASINVNALTLGVDATYEAVMDEGGISTMFGDADENFTLDGALVLNSLTAQENLPASVVLFETAGTGTIGGDFDSVTWAGKTEGTDYSIDYTTGDSQYIVNIIPEPATAGLMGLVAVLALLWRRVLRY